MFKLCIFDLDGTLIDSVLDCSICFNQALEEYGFGAVQADDFAKRIGGDLEQMVARLLPPSGCFQQNIVAIGNKYRELYSASDKPNTKPYEGITELLKELLAKGKYVCVSTNKNHILTLEVLKKLFPNIHFDMVIGSGNGVASKPSSECVEKMIATFNVKSEECVYIGDGASDIETAKNSDIQCAYVTWGQGKDSDCDLYDRIKVVNNVEELAKLLYGDEE